MHLTLGAWKASAEAGCDEGVWDEQTFEVLWAEEALEIESTVRFEPDKHRFKDWKTEVAWSFGAVDLELEHKLTRPRNWLALEVDWASDALEIDTRVPDHNGGIGSVAVRITFATGNGQVDKSGVG